MNFRWGAYDPKISKQILYFLFNGITNFVGYPNPKSSWSKKNTYTIQPIAEGDRRIHAFPEIISPKVNVIKWLELELAGLLQDSGLALSPVRHEAFPIFK